MMRQIVRLLAVLAVALVSLPTGARAEVLISDFSNFSQTGTYVQWDFGTFTSGPTDWRVQANNFGGGWVTFAPQIDASAENLIQIKVTANPDNVATNFNLVLFSGSPSNTQAGWTFTVSPGPQTLTADLNTPQFFNSGSLATWDKSNIGNEWHLQGTFGNGDPGLAMDLTFDNLALIPEPSSLVLVGLATIVAGGMRGRRRR
jgi:hypothetical protein